MKLREVEEFAYNLPSGKQDQQATLSTQVGTHTPPQIFAEKSPLPWMLTWEKAIGSKACVRPVRAPASTITHGHCPLGLGFGPSTPEAFPLPSALKWATGKETALLSYQGRLRKLQDKSKP